MRCIIIPLLDHTTDEEAQEMAKELQEVMQYHYEPRVAEVTEEEPAHK